MYYYLFVGLWPQPSNFVVGRNKYIWHQVKQSYSNHYPDDAPALKIKEKKHKKRHL